MRSKLPTNLPVPRMPRAAIYILSVVGCYLASGLFLGMLNFDSPVVAHAQLDDELSAEETATAAALERRGSVVFRDTPLAEVILILSEQWKVNIVAGSNIDGQVSGTFRQEKLEKILDSLLTANGFTYRQIGSSLVVVSKDSVAATRPNFSVEVIDIPVENSDELTELTEALKLKMSPEGSLLPIRASGKFAISDTPENIADVKQLLEQIAGAKARYTQAPAELNPAFPQATGSDAPMSTHSGAIELRPQFMTAKDLEKPLSMMLADGTYAIVEEENIIVVFGDPNMQHRARLLLQQLDRPRSQVRITGYIYDVDLGEIERLGIDWNAQIMSRAIDANGVPRNLGLSQSGLLVPNQPNNALGIATGAADLAAGAAAGGAGAANVAATGAANGGQFLFRTLNSNTELQAMVQALDQTDGSRLLADPHVTVVDRHTASLGIVTEIPIQQLTETQQGGAIGTTTFREAGITLEVTPRISSDGTIEMEVSPEFSVLAGFQNGNPIIDTRRATTTVRVGHGQALVIGGLRSKSTIETIRGIPGLMHAKFIGRLFRTHSTEQRESELIVIIMPEIVGYYGGLEREMAALDVTQRQLSRIGTASECPIGPNCKDKHCPNHHPRPRIHNGMQDNGLIGGYDTVFVSPIPHAAPPEMLFQESPLPITSPEPNPAVIDTKIHPITHNQAWEHQSFEQPPSPIRLASHTDRLPHANQQPTPLASPQTTMAPQYGLIEDPAYPPGQPFQQFQQHQSTQPYQAAGQPSTAQHPTNQYPANQYPTNQYPANQYPAAQFPAGQPAYAPQQTYAPAPQFPQHPGGTTMPSQSQPKEPAAMPEVPQYPAYRTASFGRAL